VERAFGSYKSSRLHLKKLPTRGKVVLEGPGEIPQGIVDIGQGYRQFAFKIESHNHPSFIEPFGRGYCGAGILRDIFTMGARPIAVLDSLAISVRPTHSNWRPQSSDLAGWFRGIAHYGKLLRRPDGSG